MRYLDIAICLIEQGDLYHLQLRNHTNSTGATNLIGCFGGRIEKGELAHEAAYREISEETNLNINNGLVKVGQYIVESDYNKTNVKVRAHAFKVLVAKERVILSTEGELVSISKNKVKVYMGKMTPATAHLFKNYIIKGGK